MIYLNEDTPIKANNTKNYEFINSNEVFVINNT